MDCMEYMKSIPDKYFTLCVADPPYGLNIANNPFRQRFSKKEWDIRVPNDDFFSEIFRVSVNQIIWGGNYFGLPPNKHFLIWDKVQPFNFSSSMCEYAWSSFDKPAKMFSYRVVLDKGKIHPTQKPMELYAWIFKHYAKMGDIIFDPMMGSQSSRIAAYKLGLDYVGCEINMDYFNSGNERFKKECENKIETNEGAVITQLTLF